MATSSIFQNIILDKKRDVEKFAEALEKSEQYSKPIKRTNSHIVTEKDDVERLVERMIKANA